MNRIQWRRQFRADRKVTPTTKYVVLALAEHPWRRPDGYSRRQEDLAQELGVGKRTVERALASAVDARYLQVVERGHNGRQQVYELRLPEDGSRSSDLEGYSPE